MQRKTFLLLFLTALLGISSLWATTWTVGPTGDYTTIQAAINAVTTIDGDVIQVSDGTYPENVNISKNISLLSVNGTAVTIIDGSNSGGGTGTINLTSGRNGVVIGTIGHGFTVKGIDGPPGIEYAAIYLTGAQTNVSIEGNIIEARGDAALMGEYNAANTNIVINANEITGKTFTGDNPAGVGFSAQWTLPNVPRQLVVFGGGSGTTNTQNVTFTNNIISGISGGMSITDNSGNPISPTPQGNTMASLEFAGTSNVITGNVFSGSTTRYAECLRMRGPGDYTITGNNFNGSYPIYMTAQTTTPSIGLARIQNALPPANTFGNYVTVNTGRALAVPAVYPTIQAGISAAASGNVVVASAGTFQEQLHITTNNISIIGAGKANTKVLSPNILPMYFGTGSYPVVLVDGVTTVTIEDLTIDGNGAGNSNYKFMGLAFWNAGGVVDNVDVTGVRDTPFSGAQHGVGVYAYNNTSGPYTITCSNMVIDDYQKNAMALSGAGLTVDLDNITTIGAGPTTVTAQNGIQIGFGAGGTIDDCDISGNIYTGSGWSSGGVLGYQGSAITVTDTDVYDNYVNIDMNDNSLSMSGGTISNTDPDAWDGIYFRNPAVRSGEDGTGRVIPQPQPMFEDYTPDYGRTNFELEIEGVDVIGCDKEDAWGILIRAYGNTQVATITECEITGWDLGIYTWESGGVVDCEASNNQIYDNASYGFYSNTAIPQLAIMNYWGDATGPYHYTTNTDGLGNAVSDNVEYDPWWGDEEEEELESEEYIVNQTQNTYHSTIQAAINAASTRRDGDLIEVPAGTYVEDIHIDRALTLRGEDAETTIISGPIGGSLQTVFIDYSNVTFENFTVTREGNNTTDWNNGETNQTGLQISQQKTGCLVQNNIITKNRNGLYFNDCQDNTVINNLITNNRTGIQLVNNVSDFVIEDNIITDNWTMGILFYYSGVTTPTTGIRIEDNDISGNWYSQVECKTQGTNPTVSYDCSPNWFGSPSPYKVTSLAGEPGYAAQIPVEFGGTAVSPGGNEGKISGQESHKILIDPWWINEEMDILNTDIEIYISAQDELIADNENQQYSVIISDIASLRGYTVQVKIPQADFYQPTDFAIGPVYQNVVAYPDGYQFIPMDVTGSDINHWIYDVTGTYLGGHPGIDGTDVVLFTFWARSLSGHDNIPTGCWITAPLDEVVLKDDQNPYHEIPCSQTSDKFILIDATEPTITIDNIDFFEDGMTLPIDPALTVTNGWPSVAVPPLSLDYWDNYNLDYSQYVLVTYGSEPTTVAEFAGSTYLFGPDYANATYDDLIWDDPDGDLNAALNDLPDGHYTLSFLAVDDAGNFVIVNWSFFIDKTATGPIVWDSTIPCRTTANANNSIDLKWANPVGAVKNHIWILSYGDIGSNTHYPEYEDHSEPTIPTALNPYNPAVQNGWTRNIVVDPVPATFPYAITGMARGYYYVTIFAEDASGNISVAPVNPFYRESISYWPGDVPAYINGLVTIDDINVLSLAWGAEDGDGNWNNMVDVGPSTDYARRSRPTPDDVIDIEDLMMFAMNYNNTNYNFYPRNIPEPNPITIAMHLHNAGSQYVVTLELGENAGFVKGLNIPVSYGDGLALQSLELGDIWPEGSLLLHTDRDGVVTVSISTLGAEPLVLGNGTIATLTFDAVGVNTGLGFEHMTARTWDNREIEIVNNPGASTDNDDLVNVIPDASYLGKNYPNPFTGSTTIAYGLKEAGSVKLSVFNSRGQLIRTLVNDAKAPGSYQINWNGLDNNNRPVSSGVYFFRMETQGLIKTVKGLLIK